MKDTRYHISLRINLVNLWSGKLSKTHHSIDNRQVRYQDLHSSIGTELFKETRVSQKIYLQSVLFLILSLIRFHDLKKRTLSWNLIRKSFDRKVRINEHIFHSHKQLNDSFFEYHSWTVSNVSRDQIIMHDGTFQNFQMHFMWWFHSYLLAGRFHTCLDIYKSIVDWRLVQTFSWNFNNFLKLEIRSNLVIQIET